jgi:hypothetical protein
LPATNKTPLIIARECVNLAVLHFHEQVGDASVPVLADALPEGACQRGGTVARADADGGTQCRDVILSRCLTRGMQGTMVVTSGADRNADGRGRVGTRSKSKQSAAGAPPLIEMRMVAR